MANGDGDNTGDSGSVADKIRSVRETIQRKEKSARADRRAKGRRIERGEPESTGERAAVAKRGAEEAAGEVKNLGSDAVDLLSAELGVTEGEAEGLISQGADAIQAAAEAGGGAIAELDVDGDGDTDILEALESGQFEAVDQAGRVEADEPPLGEVEDDIEPAGGIEEELGLEGPIEDQQDGGLF